MPLPIAEVPNVHNRLMIMLMDTIRTFELINENAQELFGDQAPEVSEAIKEYLDDFLHNTQASGEKHPEVLIYEATRENLQKAGFYGAQLNLKERQVTEANRTLRDRIVGGVRQLWRRPFKKWVDIINNFLGSLASATGLSEALKELKDCLRNELPDEEK